jgi:hypothetical protein
MEKGCLQPPGQIAGALGVLGGRLGLSPPSSFSETRITTKVQRGTTGTDT